MEEIGKLKKIDVESLTTERAHLSQFVVDEYADLLKEQPNVFRDVVILSCCYWLVLDFSPANDLKKRVKDFCKHNEKKFLGKEKPHFMACCWSRSFCAPGHFNQRGLCRCMIPAVLWSRVGCCRQLFAPAGGGFSGKKIQGRISRLPPTGEQRRLRRVHHGQPAVSSL